MRWRIVMPVAGLVLGLGASSLRADEVLEAAKKEKARREALQKKKARPAARTAAKGPAPVLSNRDLSKVGRASLSEATALGDVPKPSDGSAVHERDELYRNKIRDAEQRVVSARQKVEDLKAQLAEYRRQAANIANPQVRLDADRKGRETEAEIPKAEQAVSDAEAEVQRVREEARRANVTPGALR